MNTRRSFIKKTAGTTLLFGIGLAPQASHASYITLGTCYVVQFVGNTNAQVCKVNCPAGQTCNPPTCPGGINPDFQIPAAYFSGNGTYTCP